MKIYVIRHGESETNLAKKWTGWMDVKLTEKGKKDAEKAGDFLKSFHFDKIYSSDLKRAYDTMKIAVPNTECETSRLLREINIGSLAGQPLSVLTDEDKKRISKFGYAQFGGESKEEFYERIRKFMDIVESSCYENVAVFSHGGWLCGMLELVFETDIPRKHLCCDNCTIAIYEFTSKTRRLHSWINIQKD